MFTKSTKHSLFFVCTLSLFFSFSFGQASAQFGKNLNVETKLHYGFLMPHHSSIEYFLEDHIRGFEINITKSTFGKNKSEQLFRYPRIGVGFYHSNLGNNAVYGHANSLFGFMNIPFYESKNRFSVNYQIATGLAYLTKTFDMEDNYYNQAISSHINVHIRFCLEAKYRLTERLEITNDIGFTHFSNGMIKAPNQGLNLVTASIGAGYSLNGRISPEKTRIIIEKPSKKFEYSFIYSAGIKSHKSAIYDHFFVSSFSANAQRILNNKRTLGLGLDFFYDASMQISLEDAEFEDITTWDKCRIGIHGGHDLVYNNLSFTVQLGCYVYSVYEELTPIYTRLGLKYKLTDHILSNISLKSHYFVADFVEWGLGYYF